MRNFVFLSAFLLAAPTLAQESPQQIDLHTVAPKERIVVIDGGRNFRDAGGYRTSDGRTVKWGVLYRSGSLGSLTAQGMSQIDRQGISSIIDLRTLEERQQDMSNWLAMSGHGYWARDYQLTGMGGVVTLASVNPAKITADDIRTVMTGAYRAMPRALASHYRELFARLSSDRPGAVVVNCTAGKDRTGIATALVLTALGVSYETAREDFLLSNTSVNMKALQQALAGPLSGMSPEIARPLLGVEGGYLDAAFEQIRLDYGSVDAYLQRELGVGPLEIAALRRRMLE